MKTKKELLVSKIINEIIETEIPLPHIQDNLDKFITENDKTKN